MSLLLERVNKDNTRLVCLYVGPASETPKFIHYRLVLYHTPDIGLIDLLALSLKFSLLLPPPVQ